MKVLLTGATGYVGGRLLRPLKERGDVTIRCLSRRPESLRDRVDDDIEVVHGDLLEPETLVDAFEDIDVAYYLVHSMGSGGDFADLDRTAAANFAEAATQAGVKRIVYLGALGMPEPALSEHLRSRQEVGNLLRLSSAQVIEFRASIIIGSGSLSFELIRALVERLPMMVCPRWSRTVAQPIGIEDVLQYLTSAIDLEGNSCRVYEIGGPDQIGYLGIMKEYARQRGLRRLMLPVPLLTPYISSLWLGLVTPVYARTGRKLVEGLRNPTVVSHNLAERAFGVQPLSVSETITRAIQNEDREIAETRWSDALSSGSTPPKWGGVRFGNRLVDSRKIEIPVSPEEAFAPIRRIGGKTGWYYGNFLWRIRGWMDLVVGGVGVRRGRRDPEQIRVGDALDFWRVEQYEPNQLLRLSAEMKVPGRAWLEFQVTEIDGGSCIQQTALFDPIGLFGLAYWYSVWPLHQFVFSGMLRNIARTAYPELKAEPEAVTEVETCAPEGTIAAEV